MRVAKPIHTNAYWLDVSSSEGGVRILYGKDGDAWHHYRVGKESKKDPSKGGLILKWLHSMTVGWPGGLMTSERKRYHRGDQVIRQWRIIRLLINSSKGLTVKEITDMLDTGIRTIYRDLAQLEAAEFPIYYRPGPGRGSGSWHIAGSEMTKREREFFKRNEPPGRTK